MNNHIYYPQAVSTNTILKELMQENPLLPQFTVVSAGYQTSGRGQRQNVWESEVDKNLLFTMLLTPTSLSSSDAFNISKIVSVAIAEWLQMFVKDVKIKWPNDIYSGDKKICGILIENSIMGANLSSAVVGVGININQTNFSPTLPNPISIANLTQKEYDLDEMLEGVVEEIKSCYSRYFEGGEEEIDSRYHNMLYRLNILAKYNIIDSNSNAKKEEEATIVGVEQNGCLCLKHTDATVRSYAFKEVEFVL